MKYLLLMAATCVSLAAQIVNPGGGSGSGGSGTVTSVTAGCGLGSTQSPLTTAGTIYTTVGQSAQTGNYAVVTGNCGQYVTNSTASAAMTIPSAGSAGFAAGWYVWISNTSGSSQTITTTTTSFSGCGLSGTTATIAASSSILLVVNAAGNGWSSLACGSPGSTGPAGAGYGGTSSSSVTLAGNASYSWTTQAGLAYGAATYVQIVCTSNSAISITGYGSYSGTTMTIANPAVVNNGSCSSWSISLATPPQIGYAAVSASTYTIQQKDCYTVIDAPQNGTVNIALLTPPCDLHINYLFSSGVLTIGNPSSLPYTGPATVVAGSGGNFVGLFCNMNPAGTGWECTTGPQGPAGVSATSVCGSTDMTAICTRFIPSTFFFGPANIGGLEWNVTSTGCQGGGSPTGTVVAGAPLQAQWLAAASGTCFAYWPASFSTSAVGIKDPISGSTPPTWVSKGYMAIGTILVNSGDFIYMGWSSDQTSATSGSFAGLRYDKTANKWECVITTAGTPVVTNLSWTPDTAFHTFDVANQSTFDSSGLTGVTSANTLYFRVDGGAATTCTGTLPSFAKAVFVWGDSAASGSFGGSVMLSQLSVAVTNISRSQ